MSSTALGRHIQQSQHRLSQQQQQKHRNHKERRQQQAPPAVISATASSCASALTTPSALLWRHDEDDDTGEDNNDGGLDDDDDEEEEMEDVELSSSSKRVSTNHHPQQPQPQPQRHLQDLEQLLRHPRMDDERAVHPANNNDDPHHQFHHLHNLSRQVPKQPKHRSGSDMEQHRNSSDTSEGRKRRQRRPWFASTSTTSSSSPYVSSLRNSYIKNHHHPNNGDDDTTNNNNYNHRHNKNNTKQQHPYPNNTSSLTSLTTGIQYRTIDSTQRALRELQKQRMKKAEKRRALLVSITLFGMAGLIHGFGRWNRSSQNATTGGGGGQTIQYSKVMDKFIMEGSVGNEDGSGLEGSEQDASFLNVDASAIDGEAGMLMQILMEDNTSSTSEEEDGVVQRSNSNNPQDVVAVAATPPLPPPEEKTYEDDPDRQFLLPLRYYADMTDPYRHDTDTAYFFQVPRSGGGAVKDILGKCLRLVMCTEVGIRNGHESDTVLQVLGRDDDEEEKDGNTNNNSGGGGINVQGRIQYVNVDTTNAFGIQRAAAMGLASSGLADVIVSSYFHDASMLFDLHHQGRAFLILRDPIERATSVYYHRVKTVGDLDASVISLEEYAKGNGIENNWMTRFLTNHMAGELTKTDLDQAKEILKEKFLIGFLDDLEESVYRIMKFNGWAKSSDEDETAKMNQEDCIHDLITRGGVWSSSRWNEYEYEVPKRGTQAHALIAWQTQFDSKLYSYAKELFDLQTKEWGTKERKKLMKKMLKGKIG